MEFIENNSYLQAGAMRLGFNGFCADALTHRRPTACAAPAKRPEARDRAALVLVAAGKLQERPMTCTKLRAFFCVRIVFIVAAALVSMPAAASTLVDAIDQGIKHKNWTQVERASLRWALHGPAKGPAR